MLEGTAGGTAARNPAVELIHTLAKADPRRRAVMHDSGVLGTLRRVAEWGGGVGVSFGVGSGSVGVGAGIGSTGIGSGSPGAWGGSRSVGGGGAGNLHSAFGATTTRGGLVAPASVAAGPDQEREVVRRARAALEWLEHGETYVGGVF